MLSRISRYWDLLAAIVAAVAGGLWLSGAMISDVTTELITFFGIQAAIILPAMIFTASVLRPEGLTLPEAKRYRKALRSQMIFWIVLLALDFLTVASLIFGKAAKWTFLMPQIRDIGPIDFSGLVIGVTVLLGTIALLRTVPFIRGVLSLHELNCDLAEKAIKLRNSSILEEFDEKEAANAFHKPEGYGEVVNRH